MNESSTPGTDDVIFYSSNDIDDIKVISSQIIHVEIPVSSSFVIDRKETPEEEHKRKRINRIVGFFASLIFLTCVVLVCSSMMMSKNIDELVEEDVQGKIFFTHQLNDSGSSDTLSIHHEFAGNSSLSSHQKKHRTSILDDFKLFPNESTRKNLIRAILTLTCMFVVLSGILLIVTLNMSEEIDDKVRQSNVLLRQKTVTKTSMHTPILVEISNSTEP